MNKKRQKGDLPLVSIIIPTYNSERTLEKCLRSINDQDYPNIEVIIVDGGSHDRTIEIAKKFGTTVVVLPNTERSEAINYGAKIARGKYIYRVDSDVLLDPHLVSECVHKCEHEGYDALSIMWLPDPNISFWARVRRLEKECYYAHKDINRITARFIRKDVFDSIGGFNENLVAGEDYDLQNRLLEWGYKIGFAKHTEIHIGEPRNIIDIIKKNYYYGKTLPQFFKISKSKGIKQVSPIRLPLLKCWKNFVSNPLLTLGFIVYYVIVYLSSFMGILSGILLLRASGNSTRR